MYDIKYCHHWILEYLPLWIFFCEMILLIDHVLQTRVEEAERSSVLFRMNMNYEYGIIEDMLCAGH